MPSGDDIMSYITDNFVKEVFFTQLAVIKEDELFSDTAIINSLKLFLKEAFVLHLEYEVERSNNPKMDYNYVLNKVKELDCLTKNLVIPNSTQRNAASQINASELAISTLRRRRTTYRSRR
jgi:hypothetical protein